MRRTAAIVLALMGGGAVLAVSNHVVPSQACRDARAAQSPDAGAICGRSTSSGRATGVGRVSRVGYTGATPAASASSAVARGGFGAAGAHAAAGS
jgi:hypothetical protein